MKKIHDKHFVLDVTTPLNLKSKIKKILKGMMAIGYKIQMNLFCNTSSNEKKYKVSICAIFKNEAPYLKEWIEFNHIIGIEHFYLYNNNSDDDYISILQPYISSGLVTLVQWPKNQAQMECYNDCIVKYRSETQWLGFIDIDEFIVPIEMNNIYEFLKPFEKNRGSVKIYWKMYGTSGMLERNLDTLVTEQFTIAWPKYYSVGKCFYNTNYDYDFNDKKNTILHHLFWSNYHGRSIPPVNAFDKVCLEGYDCVKCDRHPIQINHYFTKSYKEYAMKRAKGDVYFEINPHDEEYFYLHEMENTDVDYSAYKYLVKLKIAMEKK
ncbi:MAG TPA: glycosyltransferase family 92 protein [Lachnospiraceae bacterium]|nr:glycosyltransferase family 92 protein [Lachnospiraceae bacterium]